MQQPRRRVGRGIASRVSAFACALPVIATMAAGCGGSDSNATGAGGGTSTASKDPIVVGSVLDITGALNIYGKPVSDATKLAVDDINAHGGVLGRKLKLVSYDAQSAQEKYTQYANRLVLQDKPAVIMGGITSASREAIRPIFDRAKVLYFYNEQYEGGVCDKNTFLTGAVPSQQFKALIPYAIKHFGKRLYVAAADYNFGHTAIKWVEQYAEENGGQVVKSTFIPLESSDFGPVIDDLQKVNPDVVVSLLVGGNHIAFYRQFASTGLGKSMTIVSPTFGTGNEQVVLSPTESAGITVVYPFYQELNTPESKAFVDAWHERYGSDDQYVSDSAVTAWNGWHLWAAAVNKAGTLDRDKVISTLEDNQTFDAPSGQVQIDGGSHHLTQNFSIAETDDKHGFKVLDTSKAVPPVYEQQKCDLKANPTLNKEFTP